MTSKTLVRMATLALAGLVVLCYASTALASTRSSTTAASSGGFYRPFPEGLPAHNAQQAFKMVIGRASWDDQYAHVLAQQTGSAAFSAASYRAQGYKSHAPKGTTNSAVNGQGNVVPLADHNGSQNVRVFIVMNFATNKTVALMVRCGNPRLRPFVPVIPWHKFHKGTIIRINRTVSKPVSITCPSGQTVSGTLYASVKGFFKARTWGKVQGKLNLKLQATFKLQLKTWVTLHCGPAPPPPPPPPPSYKCTGLGLSTTGDLSVAAAISISTSTGVSFKSATISWGDGGSTTDGLNQSHTYAAGGTYNVNAVVTFNLPDSTTASASCSASVTVTPKPPAHFTTVSCTGPEEISGDAGVIVKCDVTDDNGAPISLNAQSQDSNSQVTGINCFSQGGAPSCQGNGQFEFRVNGVNDTNNILTTTIKVYATANGVRSDPVFMTFDVDPSGGGF